MSEAEAAAWQQLRQPKGKDTLSLAVESQLRPQGSLGSAWMLRNTAVAPKDLKRHKPTVRTVASVGMFTNMFLFELGHGGIFPK